MANANVPSGLTPVKNLNGSPWNGQANIYSIATSYATALYIGDPVVSSGTADANGVPGIAIYGGTGAIRGVIVGFGNAGSTIAGDSLMGNVVNPNIIYRPASDANQWYAMVVDDPNVIFEVQENSNGTQLAATEVGLNTVLKSGTGSTVSGWLLSSYSDATPATTATLAVRLLGLSRYPAGANVFGAYAKWLIQINVHELGHGTGAAGV